MQYREEREMKFLGFENMAMMDWDFPDSGHKSNTCVTITTASDAMELVYAYCHFYPEALMAIQLTKGGVRGWRLDKPFTVNEFAQHHKVLKCDPIYARLSVEKGLFWSRVSPKPNRKNDVITTWCYIGNGEIHNLLVEPWRVYLQFLHANSMLTEHKPFTYRITGSSLQANLAFERKLCSTFMQNKA